MNGNWCILYLEEFGTLTQRNNCYFKYIWGKNRGQPDPKNGKKN